MFQRRACEQEHFDKKSSELVRMENEPGNSDSPHLVAVCVER